MYILVDVKRMRIVHRCPKVETVRALAHIEFVHSSTGIFEETHWAAYSCLAVENLQELFKGLTGGVDPHSRNFEFLVGQIMRLCQSAKPSDVDAFEAIVQSQQITQKDKGCYRYAKGQSKPHPLNDPYAHPALLGNWQAAQGLPLPNAATAPPTPAIAPPVAEKPCAAAPKYAPPWL